MDEDKITVIDSNYREPMSDKMSQELREYEAEKLRQAEEREERLLNKRGFIDVCMDGIDKIKSMFAKKKAKEITAQNSDKQH